MKFLIQKNPPTLTFQLVLSVLNWYWRTWEVLFGVVVACIPTLRPLYKYLLQSPVRLTSRNTKSSSKPTTNPWSSPHPKPPNPFHQNKPYNTKLTQSVMTTREESILRLQNFSGVSTSDDNKYLEARDIKQQQHTHEMNKTTMSDENLAFKFKPSLHLHGDESTKETGTFQKVGLGS